MKYESFKRNINYDGPLHEILGTKCHLWTGIEKDGHGIYSKGIAHRLLWIHLKGEIGSNLVVRHKCDIGICVNIEHLELGTIKDNVNDMVERGRVRTHSQKGEITSQSKLTLEKVLSIRENKNNLSHNSLAKLYNISRQQVSRIIKGEQWKDISIQMSKEQQFLNRATQGCYNEKLQSYCLEMPKSRMSCYFNNKSKIAHRIAWEIKYGPIPDNMFILHKCDNAKCINYSHLELGDHKTNMLQRQERNRTAIGTRQGSSKLSENDVIYIRKNPDNKSNIELQKLYNVSKSTIYDIQKNKSYKNIKV
jgi:Mor family transcriptional regulator